MSTGSPEKPKTPRFAGFRVRWARQDSNLRRHKPSDLQSDAHSPELTDNAEVAHTVDGTGRETGRGGYAAGDTDPELKTLIDNWPNLPHEVRQKVIGIVQMYGARGGR